MRSFGVRDVREAGDGQEAVKTMRHWAPDIVLTDLQMHLSDGLELTRCIRHGEARIDPQTPIILMTGHSEFFHVSEARDAGVDEFLAKPLSIASLLERIAAVVDRPRPFIVTASYRGPDRRRLALADYEGPWRRSTDAGDLDLDQIDSFASQRHG